MTAPTTHPTQERSRAARIGTGTLLTVVGVFLSIVVMAPIALSSGDLIRWAASPTGLGLDGGWPWLVFVALDAAAGVCVLIKVYSSIRGQSAGAFGLLVWVFAGFSALANYRHGLAANAPGDAWWFFPAMSVLGPGLLEAVTWFIRRAVQRSRGTRAGDRAKFGIVRWLPIVGAPRDTYGAYRTAQILNIPTVAEAVATYHALCPNGSLRVVRAIRARNVAAAKAADRAAARSATTAPTNGRTAAATSRPSPATVRSLLPTDHDQHAPTAVANAATIRATYPTGLPTTGRHRKLRAELGWSGTKVANALRAYDAGADLHTNNGSVTS